MKEISLQNLLEHSLAQDQGSKGDVTSKATISSQQQASASLVVKAKYGILSGLDTCKLVFKTQDPSIVFTPLFHDGDKIKKGDILAQIQGNARNILAAERVSLEFLRRLSGIASKTNEFVNKVKDTKTKILDTRKVLPGFGSLDKKAVRDGGGTNHRLNLSEMGLIKNNHIDVLGGDISKAIKLFRKKYPSIPLEVEVRNKKELLTALQNHPDRILLDNMTNSQMRTAVMLRNNQATKTGLSIPLEASGNMTLKRVASIAKTGVEYISAGSLTHSVEAFDISLHITFNK